MYLVLNTTKCVIDVTSHASYVRRQDNGVVITCPKEEADGIYSQNTDRFYPINQDYASDGHTLIEVDEVPDEVEVGYYSYHAGEFYTTPEQQEALNAIREKEQQLVQLKEEADAANFNAIMALDVSAMLYEMMIEIQGGGEA